MQLVDKWLKKEVILPHRFLLLIGYSVCKTLAATVLVPLIDPLEMLHGAPFSQSEFLLPSFGRDQISSALTTSFHFLNNYHENLEIKIENGTVLFWRVSSFLKTNLALALGWVG